MTKKSIKANVMLPPVNVFPKKKAFLIASMGIVVVLLVITAFALKNKPVDKSRETADLIKKVSVLITLPKEVPSVATVADKSKLSDQSFFKNAENGDKVLIFTDAKKAYLYRPSSNKIIEVGPININTPEKLPPLPKTTTEPISLRVAIYNGTQINGLASDTEAQINAVFPSYKVVIKANAKQKYSATFVIDLTGTHLSEAEAVAKSVGGMIQETPKNEEMPDADILIILGQ